MELIEIRSSHSLLTSIPHNRPTGEHTYWIHCQQYLSVYKSWLKENAAQERPLPVMTLGFERIWVTAAESKQIQEAVQAMRSPITID